MQDLAYKQTKLENRGLCLLSAGQRKHNPIKAEPKKIMVEERWKKENMDEFHDNRPSFFTIIFEGFTTEHLRIPPKFVKYIWEGLSDRAILRGPSGDKWDVKVCKNTNGIYLQDGWQQFLRDHSLGKNEFLIFKYDGDLCFEVQIFSGSGCEIVYGSTNTTQHDTAFADSKRRKPGRPRENFRTEKSNAECSIPRQRSRPIETSKVWKTAESFTSEFPYFESCMRQTSVENVFVHPVPAHFSRTYLPKSKAKMRLWNSEGKFWEVIYINKGINHMFSGGWRNFARDNKLKIGDTCIFELVTKNEIRVHIFQ